MTVEPDAARLRFPCRRTARENGETQDPVWITLSCLGVWPALGSGASASDFWHVEARPKVLAQQIKFSNAGANLVGTVYLPETGDHLPAVVALHGASDATRDQALYRHLGQGLPAMGIALLIYDRRGSGASPLTMAFPG